ncbi:MAG TPA: LacI family DNA-binding transcriptional regulator [Mycobacteriales bacterium]|nr:LacI family DNA-binding transcriptional regulator [Mycobacteriales bacterium]
MTARPTIHDVARVAGVAASTVSRAYSQPGRISDRTREHVLKVAADLGFRPNPAARALPSGKTLTLGLLVPDITNPFFFGLIRGAERQAAAAGFTLVLGDSGESAAAEEAYVERLGPGVDGFVLASSRLSETTLQRIASEYPIVAVNRVQPGLASVLIDNDAGIREAALHLHELGHEQIVYLSGPDESWSNRMRWAALERAGADLGLRVRRLGPFAPVVAGGTAAAAAAVADGATAAVAFNALLAIGTLQRLAEDGIAVPDQLSVIGCDDIFGADFAGLTTLCADLEQAGRSAVDLLLAHIDTSNAPEPVSLGSRLEVRRSTGPRATPPR